MKKLASVLVLLVLTSAATAWAEVNLQLPKSIQIVALNGVKANLTDKVILKSGTNQIALRVAKDLGKKFEAEMEYSDVYVLKFSAAEEDTLQLRAPRIRSVSNIRAFNQEPKLTLSNSLGSEVDYEIDKLEKGGLQFMRDFEREIANFNMTDSPAAVSTRQSQVLATAPAEKPVTSIVETKSKTAVALKQSAAVPAAIPAKKGAIAEEKMAEDMLKYWYDQADEETRKKFKKMISE